MFVDVTNPKSPLAVENILMPYKKGRLALDKKSRLPKEPITPDVCMEVLRSTNYARNIKDMLLCIAELPQEEQAQFKDVVLACFSNREQPDIITQLGENLALDGGYLEEFSQAKIRVEGDFLLSSAEFLYGFFSVKDELIFQDFAKYHKLDCSSCLNMELNEIKNIPSVLDLSRAQSVKFKKMDLTNLKQIKVAQNAKIYLRNISGLPQNLDLSACSEIGVDFFDLKPLENWKYAPEMLSLVGEHFFLTGKVDFSAFSKIYLTETSLDEATEVCFPKNAVVFFKKCRMENMNFASCKNVLVSDCRLNSADFSSCENVKISSCDLEYGFNLNFNNVRNVCLDNLTNVMSKFDFSTCDKLQISSCDLKYWNELNLRKDAEIVLNNVQNLPANVDFSRYKSLEIKECNLSALKQFSFQKGAAVLLDKVVDLPKDVDFSPCSIVRLEHVRLDTCKRLRFGRNAVVSLEDINYLPYDTDFSGCKEVVVRGKNCSWCTENSNCFQNVEKVELYEVKFLKNINVSDCDELKLVDCNLSGISELNFKKGAKVDLNSSRYLPPHLDFSSCSEVNLAYCDLSKQNDLCFEEGAKVNLKQVQNFPARLDFSKCAFVNLEYCNFNDVKSVIFKNREQMIKSEIEFPDGWNGSLLFAEEKSDLNLAMMTAKTKGGR